MTSVELSYTHASPVCEPALRPRCSLANQSDRCPQRWHPTAVADPAAETRGQTADAANDCRRRRGELA